MIQKRAFVAALASALALACSSFAMADTHTSQPPPDPSQDKAMVTAGFLSGHPDLRFRLLGLEKRDAGKQEDALAYFRRAAYYADKPSQGMVAEMLWNGIGAPADKPAAYAWMDLAAERGYEGFLDLRERYWARLDEAQRARAVELGQEIYARYGDEAALPRISTAIQRGRKAMTGSRTGVAGNLKIYIPGHAGSMELIDGSKFYDSRFWDPRQYLAWHDAIWAKPRVARVDIGGVESMPSSAQPTRIPTVAPQPDAPEPQTDDAMPTLQDHDDKQ